MPGPPEASWPLLSQLEPGAAGRGVVGYRAGWGGGRECGGRDFVFWGEESGQVLRGLVGDRGDIAG